MNTERLLTLLQALQRDEQSHQLTAKLTELHQALASYVSTENDETAKKFSDARQEFQRACGACTQFLPVDQAILESTKQSHFAGMWLGQHIEMILAGSQMTPSSGQIALHVQLEEYQQFLEVVSSTIRGLTALGTETTTLRRDEGEISVLVPKSMVSGSLGGVKKALNRWLYAFRHIQELITKNPDPVRIRTLGTSEILIVVVVTAVVADKVLNWLNRLLDAYKKSLEIRLLRNQLKEQGLLAQELKGIDGAEQKRIKTEVASIKDDALKEFGKQHEEGRKNELATGLQQSLMLMIEVWNKGGKVQVALPPSPEVKATEDEDDQHKKQRKAFEARKKALEQSAQLGRSLAHAVDRLPELPEGHPEPPDDSEREQEPVTTQEEKQKDRETAPAEKAH